MDFHGWMVGLATRVPFSGLCTRRLARGEATVRVATTVPVAALCNGPGESWRGPWRRCHLRLQFRSQRAATGLARVAARARLATTVSVCGPLQQAWQRARPRGDWDLQLRSQFSVAGLARVWAAGYARDCSSGFRPPCVSLQWLSFSAQGPEHTSYDVAAPCHVRSIASVAHESSH